MTLGPRLHNSGEEVTQSLLHSSRKLDSPWDDVVVPVGVIENNGGADISIPLDIPVDTIPRYDKLQPMLLVLLCRG